MCVCTCVCVRVFLPTRWAELLLDAKVYPQTLHWPLPLCTITLYTERHTRTRTQTHRRAGTDTHTETQTQTQMLTCAHPHNRRTVPIWVCGPNLYGPKDTPSGSEIGFCQFFISHTVAWKPRVSHTQIKPIQHTHLILDQCGGIQHALQCAVHSAQQSAHMQPLAGRLKVICQGGAYMTRLRHL